MSRSVLAALSALVLFALVAAGAAGARSPEAHAAGKCHLSSSEQRHLGASYVTSLSVRGVSCRTGKAVVRAYHKCRGSARGRCHHKVKRFSCSEHRAGISTQFDARVACKRGGKRVNFTYTQNT
jgi:hypothetical protein